MVDGNWVIKMTGRGKIDPGGDADEIQEQLKGLILTLRVAGHKVTSGGVKKQFDGDEL